MNKKVLIISASVLGFIVLLAWLFIESTKPLPGVSMLQNGRDHLPEGSKTDYKFNPPTSGNHYPSWIKKGFYNEPRADGNLVHSQEHGYIIFWYDCDRKWTMESGPHFASASRGKQWTKIVYAAELSSTAAAIPASNTQMTDSSEGSPSATLAQMPKSFSDGSCDNLKNQIKNVMKQNNEHKLIAVPRTGLDHPLVLTAWGRADKLNSVDEGEIKRFIDAFRDAGPEATNEP